MDVSASFKLDSMLVVRVMAKLRHAAVARRVAASVSLKGWAVPAARVHTVADWAVQASSARCVLFSSAGSVRECS